MIKIIAKIEITKMHLVRNVIDYNNEELLIKSEVVHNNDVNEIDEVVKRLQVTLSNLVHKVKVVEQPEHSQKLVVHYVENITIVKLNLQDID